MYNRLFSLFTLVLSVVLHGQSYPPQAGQPGSTAIYKDSSLFVGWATGITVERGFVQISDTEITANGSNKATSGIPENALGFPIGNTVSLGDGGSATLTFDRPIIDGDGFDFAVFENGNVGFLELAFVEISSDGEHFFRFPSHSQTQSDVQLGTFGTPSANYLNNLAGKYDGLYGTPFDLSELPEDDLLDKNNITHVKIIDVVGSIDPDFASFDSFGNAVNDPFPTPFASSGFDLQAVGVINSAVLSTDDWSKSAIFLYPNPATDQFYINVEENAEVAIFDISGKAIIRQTVIAKNPVNVSKLNNGMYLVEVSIPNKNQKTISKLIIN